MKKYLFLRIGMLLIISTLIITGFRNIGSSDPVTGAWRAQDGSREDLINMVDGYFVHTAFDKNNKQFFYTWGGPYQIKNGQFVISVEFHTTQKDKVGQETSIPYKLNNQQLVANVSGKEGTFQQLDNGTGNLAGLWQIARRGEGAQQAAIRPGPRKTLKILSATRFQWVAINTATKEFFGTGGGAYTLANGKYTEHIEFFSRDSSRVGAFLGFDADVKDREWLHRGLSSKGDRIEEIWQRPGK